MKENTADFRPKSFDQVVGQDDIKEYLKIKIAAFKKSGLSIGHILFLGFSGVGKTTLATVMATEMGVGFHQIMALLGQQLNLAHQLINQDGMLQYPQVANI